MVFSDSHVHLHAYADVAGLLERAHAVGVGLIVGVGVDVESSQQTVQIAAAHNGVVAAVGVHPVHLDAPFSSQTVKSLEALAQRPEVGFIGEIGLDTVEGRLPFERQLDALEAQIAVARSLRLPVNLHLRGADELAFDALRRAGLPAAGAVLHYFVGDVELVRRALDLGLFISVGKPVTRAENDDLRKAMRTIPLDRLLIETDSYPLPGRTTEPSDAPLVAQAVGDLLGLSADRIGDVTTENLLRLLGPRSPGLSRFDRN